MNNLSVKTVFILSNQRKYRSLGILIVISVMVFLSMAHSASAATYYLDAAGGNDSNPGTSEQSWQTLAKAQSTVISGDTVIVRNGEYGGYYEIAVDRTDWVTYRATEGHNPTLTYIEINNWSSVHDVYLAFDGFTITPPVDKRYVIQVKGSIYTKFLNLNVIGQGAMNTIGGFYTTNNSSNLTIDNCTFSGGANTGRYDGFGHALYVPNCDNLVITNNEIRQFSSYGIFVTCMNVTIKNNNIHQIGGDGIFISGGSGPMLIENNQIHDLYIYRPDISETSVQTTWSADGKTMTNPDATWGVDEPIGWINNIEIRVISGNNVNIGDDDVRVGEVVSPTEIRWLTAIKADPEGATPSNVDYFLIDKGHGDLLQVGAGGHVSNLTIRKNRFYDCYSQLWWVNPKIMVGDDPMGGHNFLIENNLFWNSFVDGGGAVSHVTNMLHIDGLVFRNNIVIGQMNFEHSTNVEIYNNIVSYIRVTDTVISPQMDYNIFNRGSVWSPHEVGPYTIYFNPGYSMDKWNDPAFTGIFADYANGNFQHASATSLGVGHGDPANDPNSDILGVSRSIPDAGCYEYVADIQDDTAPSDPQNLQANAVSQTQIDLSWNESSDPNSGISHYNIYRDGSFHDTSATNSYSDTNLTPGTLYSYRVSAVNGASPSLESGQSNAAQATTHATPSDSIPPVITNIQSTNVEESTASITWTTDENSTSQVEYGTTTGYGNLTNLDTNLVTSHSVTLTSLESGTVYHFQVISVDAAGNEADSSDYTFTTQDSAPSVGSLTINISPQQAIDAGAQWNVNGGAWKNSGDTVTGLSVGGYTVNYKSITGWTAPTSEGVTIVDGQTTTEGGTYIQQTYTLAVSATNGTITRNPDQASYNHGESVALTAMASTGYKFTSWLGNLSGSANPATITMDSNKSITANFTKTSTGGGGASPADPIKKPDKVNENEPKEEVPVQDLKDIDLPSIPKINKPINKMTILELKAKIQEILITIRQLQSLLSQKSGITGIPGIPDNFVFQTNLKYGQSNVQIKYLQIFLNQESSTQVAVSGYGSSGNETNYFGLRTKQAVIRFQEKHRKDILSSYNLVKGTGFVGKTTRAKLNEILK